jgi:multisubunit Na+/H+ antiporter MnhE subunit
MAFASKGDFLAFMYLICTSVTLLLLGLGGIVGFIASRRLRNNPESEKWAKVHRLFDGFVVIGLVLAIIFILTICSR